MGSFTRAFILVFMGSVLFQSCLLDLKIDLKTVKGNGNVINKELKIEDYKEISISGSADIIYEQRSWDEPYLQVMVDENILPLLDIEVRDHKLIIQTEDHSHLKPTQFKIYTSSSAINKIRISGSGDARLKGEVNTDHMEADISGSGSLTTDSLYCERFDLDISGSGKANLGGVCNDAFFEISGSGRIEAFDYQVQDLKCSVSGSGRVKAHVNRSLDASVSGSGRINYKGNPQKIDQKISGAGSISKEQ